MDFYLWQDSRDRDVFAMGIKTSRNEYSAWTQVHIDGIQEMFGSDVKTALRMLQNNKMLHVSVQASDVVIKGF